ncbi:MAG: hypothetical protein ACJ0BW_03980 [Pontiellaceae bacterium]
MAKKSSFFSKHAKSSAFIATIVFHAIIILIAVGLVAYEVITKDEKKFVAKENNRPKMKLKKLQVPIKMEKRKKTTAKLRKRVVAKKARVSANDIRMPEITGVSGGLGAMQGGGGLGSDIGFTMPEIDFFGAKQRSEKVVFVVLAGGASTKGSNDKQSPKSRMVFHTLKARLFDMVDDLPEYALFNAAFFQMNMTTPFSTNMLLATDSNKELMKDWAEPVNNLYLEETYGPGGVYQWPLRFWERYKKLDWYAGEVMTNNVPPVYPKWVYHYTPGPHIQKHFVNNGARTIPELEFIHWNRAVCFALEQKPDAIFILSTNYIGEDPSTMVKMLNNICKDIYGEDSRKYPTINVVLMRTLLNPTWADQYMPQFLPIINSFRGRYSIIDDIRDLMTEEEKEMLDDLPGVF